MAIHFPKAAMRTLVIASAIGIPALGALAWPSPAHAEMTQPAAQVATAQEALDFIGANAFGPPILVLAPEVLQQIQDAEAAGGFEGGMSGADGEGGFSSEGNSGSDSSSATDLPALDIGLDGAVSIARFVRGVVELASSVGEATHWIAERGLGPIVIVPIEELKKLIGSGTPDDA